MCVFGAMLIKLAMSIINCWGTTNLYYLSYFREQGFTFTASSNSIIILVIIFPMIFGMLISPSLCNRFGYEFITKCCAFAFLIIMEVAALTATAICTVPKMSHFHHICNQCY